MEIDKVNSARVWVFLIFWTVLFSCKPSEPIRIGFVAGTSGRVADMGISGRDAAQLAIDECNSNGGVSGRQVQLIIKNDEQQPISAADEQRYGHPSPETISYHIPVCALPSNLI